MFFRHECFTLSNAMWYLDNSCSNHMTGDESLLSSFTPRKGWFVSYGDNNEGKIIGIGCVGKFPNPMIGEVL